MCYSKNYSVDGGGGGVSGIFFFLLERYITIATRAIIIAIITAIKGPKISRGVCCPGLGDGPACSSPTTNSSLKSSVLPLYQFSFHLPFFVVLVMFMISRNAELTHPGGSNLTWCITLVENVLTSAPLGSTSDILNVFSWYSSVMLSAETGRGGGERSFQVCSNSWVSVQLILK